jgi:hypothetical protein
MPRDDGRALVERPSDHRADEPPAAATWGSASGGRRVMRWTLPIKFIGEGLRASAPDLVPSIPLIAMAMRKLPAKKPSAAEEDADEDVFLEMS